MLYAIQGASGVYDDKYTWISGIYTNKQLAESIMNSYQTYVSTLPVFQKITLQEMKELKQNSPDPSFDWDSIPTVYTLLEFNLVTDKFMETLLTTKD